VYVVTASGQDRTGRTDTSTGAVTIGTLKGDALANALMKAETKAKRRLTLSICGLGILDETEIETIPDARPVAVVVADREIPDTTKAREEIAKLIERYQHVLSPGYVTSTQLDMEGATVEDLRRIYIEIKRDGTMAEREAEGDNSKASKAAKAQRGINPTELADEAEPVLPDEEPDEQELF
jgi:hypothetical protein